MLALRPGQRHMMIPGDAVSVHAGRNTLGGAVVVTNFFLQSYTGTRNNFTGTLGYVFTVGGAPVTVVALGRSISVSITTDHRVGLWTAAGVLLETVTVNASSPVDALGYAYAVLASPRVLSASTQYVIGSEEFNGGDKWTTSDSLSNHSAIAAIDGGRFAAGWAYPSTAAGAAETGYVPPTFYT